MRKFCVILGLLFSFLCAAMALATVSPATMSSPTPGTKLTATTVLFQWTTGTSVTDYKINIGTKAGGSDVASVDALTATSTTISTLPSNGEKLFVTLYSTIGGTQYSNAYVYYAYGTGTAGTMSSPTAGAKLAGSSQSFKWIAGTGITNYNLRIGLTAGGTDFANVTTASLSANVTGLPTNGETLYVTLKSLNGQTYLVQHYTYYASGTGTAAVMSTPASGAKLTGSSQTFTWGAGTGITNYNLRIGLVAGGTDFANVTTTTLSTNVTGLPTNGETLYVTLRSLNGKTYLVQHYTYYAYGTGTAAAITSPTPGSMLNSTIVTFNWTAGSGITKYQFLAGTTVGGTDLGNVMTTYRSQTVGNIPTDGSKIYITLRSLNGKTWLSHSYVFTADTMAFHNDSANYGLINVPYADVYRMDGGTAPYTFSVNSGTLPAGLSLNASSGEISGTPTAAGTFYFVLKAVDNAAVVAISPTFTMVVSTAPDGTHNSYVKGRYACLFQGYVDSDNSRFGFLSSLVANGSGTISSGVFDQNGRTAGVVAGTLTGNYAVGADNNGRLNITTTVSSIVRTYHYLAIANKISGATATEIGLVESDDVGGAPSGQHGEGVCYLTDSTKFVNGSIGGHSFVFLINGEDGAGTPKGIAGRYSATLGTGGGTLGSGVLDVGKGSALSSNVPFTGTYTAPNTTTGRFTGTFTITGQSSSSNYAIYIVDANRMLLLRTDSGPGLEIGPVYKQQQASYSASNLTGNFVLSQWFWELDNLNNQTGWMAEIFQGTGDGAGSITINQSFSLEVSASNGAKDYRIGDADGTVSGLTVSSNGRLVGAGVSGAFYLYDNNTAVFLSAGNNGSGQYQVGVGWLEPQATLSYTDANIAGTYLVTRSPHTTYVNGSQVDQVAITSAGAFSGFGDKGGNQDFDYAHPLAPSTAFAWDSTTLGTTDIYQAGVLSVNCVVVSATKQECVEADTSSPTILTLQQ